MKILVATDGSEYSRLALEMAAELALPLKADVTVLTVSSIVHLSHYGPLTYGPGETMLVPTEKEAGEILKEAARILRSQGIEAKLQHAIGEAAETILSVAEKEPTDMLILGSHGRTGFKRFLLGSVSSRVATHASCPVLITKLPHPARTSDASEAKGEMAK